MTANSERMSLQDRIVSYLAEQLAVSREQIALDVSFSDQGVSSRQLVALVQSLAQDLGRALSPTLAWEYPTVAEIVRHLAGEESGAQQQLFDNPDAATGEQIAIIGMSCRFPGAPDLESFWNVCWEGKDSVTEVPPSRWDVDAYYDADPATPGKTYARYGGFLEKLDEFDAAFFNISPREAVHLDPRQRLIMETSWEALEDAGTPAASLAGGNTGVFLSTLSDDYGRLVFADQTRIEPYSGTGTAHSVVANRVSYFLDLHGPSLTIDTACSGSLVALHLASQSLRSGECDLALAGGVNVILTPDSTLFFSRAGALSKTGRCRTFDSAADGFVRSEGAGVIVLKRLSDAIKDGDHVYAVVCGSAVNQDGRTNGIMAPSAKAQEAVLREAYAKAGVSPGLVQYVELHGTGTRLGDPIEAEALGRVLRVGRSQKLKCLVGSVKTNIGHTEAAAGMAGIIKTALAIDRAKLPGSIHLLEINPLIPIEQLPFAVATQSGDWPDASRRIFAGVSSFGFGGTNAHVVLGANRHAIAASESEPRRDVPLLLSAQTPAALRQLAGRYAELLQNGSQDYEVIARAAAEQKTALPERLSVQAHSRQEAIDELTMFARGELSPNVHCGTIPNQEQRLAFVYSGQGSQWAGMGRGLMQWDSFAETLRECDDLAQRLAGFSLISEIFEPESTSRLNRTDIAQLSIFAIQASLTTMLRSFDIKPNIVIGQSLGEVAAAYASGALSLSDAFLVAFERGRLMRSIEGTGRTAQIGLPHHEVVARLEHFRDRLCIAGTSGPRTTVIAGDTGSVNEFVARLENEGVFARVLQGVDIAFHSSHMDALQKPLVEALGTITPRAGQIPFFSSVDGSYRNGSRLHAEYWGDNLRQPFQFAPSIQSLLQEGISTFIEVSPHAVVGSSILQCSAEQKNECAVFSVLRRGQDDRLAAADLCGRLFVQGYRPRLPSRTPRRVVPLPLYPWQREHYWITGKEGTEKHRKQAMHHPFLGECIHVNAAPRPSVWEIDLTSESPKYLADHKVFGQTVFPGSGLVETALAAVRQLYPALHLVLEDIRFAKALVLPPGRTVRVQTVVTPKNIGAGLFEISGCLVASEPDAGPSHFTLYASGRFSVGTQQSYEPRDLAAIAARCRESVSTASHYEMMSKRGLDYGPSFANLTDIRLGSREAIARIELPTNLRSSTTKYNLHPACLDNLFQLVAPMLQGDDQDANYLPVGLRRFGLMEEPMEELWGRATSAGDLEGSLLSADLELLNQNGAVVCLVEGLELRRIDSASRLATDPAKMLYEQVWVSATSEMTKATDEPGAIHAWVCVSSGSPITDALRSIWARSHHAHVTVMPGAEYRSVDGGYTVRPDVAEDYRRVLSDLRGAGCKGTIGVVSLMALDRRFEREASEETLASWTLALINGITADDEDCRLNLVTRGAHAVADSDVSIQAVRQASLWGLGRMAFHFEHIGIAGCLLDLDPNERDPENEARSIASVRQGTDREDQIAFRDGLRYAVRMVRAAAKSTEEVSLRTNGAYLITGGLGVLGMQVADWLIARGARNIILMNRSPLPARKEWRTMPADHARFSVVRDLLLLEAKGCNIEVVGIDVLDLESLKAYQARRHEEQQPVVRGIIHAAGVLKNSQLANADLADIQAIFRPKFQGALNLQQEFGGHDLNFHVFFSSLASILPVVGQGIYAAANALLDAFASHLRSVGAPAVSIAWGPWQNGMMAQPGLTEFHSSRGMFPMDPKVCLGLLDRMLMDPRSLWIVTDADWATVRKTYPIAPPVLKNIDLEGIDEETADEENEVVAFVARLAVVTAEERERMVLEEMTRQIASVFRMPEHKLRPDQLLSAYGLDSMMATEIKNRLGLHFDLRISAVDLLKGVTPNDLVDRALAQLEVKYRSESFESLLQASEADFEQVLRDIEGMTDGEVKEAL